jgi:hypothetical protein
MTITKAIEILEKGDDWRRPDLLHKYNPKEFDEAIEVAINIMIKYLKLINLKNRIDKTLQNTKDIDSEFVDIVNKNFWELI